MTSSLALDPKIAARAKAIREGHSLPDLPAEATPGVWKFKLKGSRPKSDTPHYSGDSKRSQRRRRQQEQILAARQQRLSVVDVPGVRVVENPPCLTVQNTTGGDAFQSAPDALLMRKCDIANIARLSREDAKATLRAVRIVAPVAVDKALRAIDETWGGWPEDDQRRSLTPHQIRRAQEMARQLS